MWEKWTASYYFYFCVKQYILVDSVNELKDSNFINLQSPIMITNKVEIQYIVSKLYECNL